MNSEMMKLMYGQETDEEAGPRPQPEQLRLAGKATLIPHKDTHLAVPRIEYVESIERKIGEQQKVIESLMAKIKLLERRINQAANIAARRMNTLESQTNELKNRNPWE